MSKMRFCGSKNSDEEHVVEGQFPTGTPSVEVSIELEFAVIAAGTSAREKNQTLVNFKFGLEWCP